MWLVLSDAHVVFFHEPEILKLNRRCGIEDVLRYPTWPEHGISICDEENFREEVYEKYGCSIHVQREKQNQT